MSWFLGVILSTNLHHSLFQILNKHLRQYEKLITTFKKKTKKVLYEYEKRLKSNPKEKGKNERRSIWLPDSNSHSKLNSKCFRVIVINQQNDPESVISLPEKLKTSFTSLLLKSNINSGGEVPSGWNRTKQELIFLV